MGGKENNKTKSSHSSHKNQFFRKTTLLEKQEIFVRFYMLPNTTFE